MFGTKAHPTEYWFISFVFDAPGFQRIGNTVTPQRPFDWLLANSKEKQPVRIINFWQIDKVRYEQLKGLLA